MGYLLIELPIISYLLFATPLKAFLCFSLIYYLVMVGFKLLKVIEMKTIFPILPWNWWVLILIPMLYIKVNLWDVFFHSNSFDLSQYPSLSLWIDLYKSSSQFECYLCTKIFAYKHQFVDYLPCFWVMLGSMLWRCSSHHWSTCSMSLLFFHHLIYV